MYTPKQDLIFKKIFTSQGNEDLLKGFINTILGTTFKSVTPTIPYHIDTYKKYKELDQGTVFRTEMDVLAITENGEQVIVEVQIQKHSSFLERTVYYLCKTYTNNYYQYDNESNYKRLKPVYSINITDFDLFPESRQALNIFCLQEQQTHLKMITKQGTPLLTIAYFSLTAPIDDRLSLLYQWQSYLKYGKIDNVDNLYLKQAKACLDSQNLTVQEKELLDMATKQESIQWEIQQEKFESGVKRGLEQGVQQGVISVAQKMLLKAMDIETISELTGLKIEEIMRLKNV